MNDEHQPVLLKEVIENLAIKPDGIYIDGTFGRGGHSREILRNLGPDGRLLAFDKDPQAIATANQPPFDDARFSIVQASFAQMGQIAEEKGYKGKVQGILLDLGVSTPQLEDPIRGFSFMREGPLDMRMNPHQKLDAATWISHAREQEIADVLWEFGEERNSRRIAKAIVHTRRLEPIVTTKQLAQIIERVNPSREKKKHPATRSFQAIRIYINNELTDLQEGLKQSIDVLDLKGRLCVISFHSLEDRVVKHFMRGKKNVALPIEGTLHWKRIGKMIRPSREESRHNPKSRSARLRIAEKIK